MLDKFGSYEVLTAEMATGGSRGLRRALARAGCEAGSTHTYRKVAHRAEFQYEKRPGFLYVRSRAISSRCNDNFDEFPAAEIKKAYATFIGKPVFVNHHNENHRRARGVIIAAALHEDVNHDGSPDTWVEVLMEVDAKSFPKLAKAILAGEIDRTSMGTDVAFSVCSACGNKAATPLDYCNHIPKMKGQTYYPRTASGAPGQGEVIREICYGLGFFENSLLVEPPADPTAHFLGVEAGPGIAMTASKAAAIVTEGSVPSQVGTRYWCVNRFNSNVGFNHDRGDGKPTRKKCSYCGGGWTSDEGYYFVLALTWAQGNIPMGDLPGTTAINAFRTEDQAKSWIDQQPEGELELYPYWIDVDDRRFPDAIASASGPAKTASGEPCTVVTGGDGSICGQPSVSQWTSSRGETYYECEDHAMTPSSAPAPSGLAVGDTVKVTHVGVPKSGEVTWMGSSNCKVLVPVYEGTNRATTKEITVPQSEVTKTGSKTAAGDEWGDKGCTTCFDTMVIDQGGREVPCPDCLGGTRAPHKPSSATIRDIGGHKVRYLVPTGTPPAGFSSSDRIVEVDGQTLGWVNCGGKAYGDPSLESNFYFVEIGGSGRTHIEDYSRDGAVAQWLDQRRRYGSRTASLRSVVAFGEQLAPAEVDTMREETCPICGEKDSYNGDQCMVCEFIRPPEQFMDPDLSKAQQVDLRQTKDEQSGASAGVVCDSCGATFGGSTKVEAAMAPSKFSLPKPTSTPEDEAHDPQAGDTCPTCGEGTLQEVSTNGDAEAPVLDAFEPPDASPSDDEGNEDKADGTDDPNGKADPDGKALTDGDDGEDDESGKKPFPPKKKSVRRPVAASHHEGADVEMRPILAATLQQQHMANANRVALERIAGLAGVDLSDIYARADREVAALEPHVAGLRRQADVDNPAQPIPTPPAEAPVATTGEQLEGLNADDVMTPGATSTTDVSPDATTSLDGTGTTLDAPLNLNQQDVTKPVAGTEGPRPIEEVRIETDVRVGTPAEPSKTMWPMEGPFAEQPKVGQRTVDPRTIAAMRLAGLRLAAGTAQGEQIAIATQIVSSDMTDEVLQHEIRTLTPVVASLGQRQQAPAVAPTHPAPTRTMPSLAPTTASAPPVGGEVDAADTALFEG